MLGKCKLLISFHFITISLIKLKIKSKEIFDEIFNKWNEEMHSVKLIFSLEQIKIYQIFLFYLKVH